MSRLNLHLEYFDAKHLGTHPGDKGVAKIDLIDTIPNVYQVVLELDHKAAWTYNTETHDYPTMKAARDDLPARIRKYTQI